MQLWVYSRIALVDRSWWSGVPLRSARSHIAREDAVPYYKWCISVSRGKYTFSDRYEAGGVVRFSGACGARFLEKVPPI